MTNKQILELLKYATTQIQVNILRSMWVRQNRDDTLFNANVPEGLN